MPVDIKKEIDKIVDQWVDEVIKVRLLPTPGSGEQEKGPSLWNRFKRGLSNLFHGYTNQQNPYYWQNRASQLGVQESFDHARRLTLKEYSDIREVLDRAEMQMENEQLEKLRMVKIIRSAAEELKKRLYGIFDRMNQPAPDASPSPEETKTAAEPKIVPSKPEAAATDNTKTEPEATATNDTSIEPESAAATDNAGTEAESETAKGSNKRKNKSLMEELFTQAANEKKENPSSIRPTKDWLDDEGMVKKEKIPLVLAWISFRTDSTDDDHIINALKTELGRDTVHLVPKIDRPKGLFNYLKRALFGSEKKVLAQLDKFKTAEDEKGLKLAKKETETKSASEAKPASNAKSASSDTKSDSDAEPASADTKSASETKPRSQQAVRPMNQKEIETSSQSPEVEKKPEEGSEEEVVSRIYLNKDGSKKSTSEVTTSIKEKLIMPMLEKIREKAPKKYERLKMWWEDNYEKSRDLDIIEDLKSGSFLDSFIEILYSDKDYEIKKKMREAIIDQYIKSID